MKLATVISFLIVITSLSYAQEGIQKLSGSYTQEELSIINTENPETIKVLIYGLDNAVVIMDFPNEKSNEIVNTIDLPEGEFNFTDLGLKIENQNQYFKVNGTNKLLMVKSMWVLNNEMKNNTK